MCLVPRTYETPVIEYKITSESIKSIKYIKWVKERLIPQSTQPKLMKNKA
jgi:hypothetical protein